MGSVPVDVAKPSVRQPSPCIVHFPLVARYPCLGSSPLIGAPPVRVFEVPGQPPHMPPYRRQQKTTGSAKSGTHLLWSGCGTIHVTT